MLRPIRLFGDPVLRTPAEPVTDFDAELRNLVDGDPIAKRVQRRPQREIRDVPIVGRKQFLQMIEPLIGFLKRGLKQFEAGGV